MALSRCIVRKNRIAHISDLIYEKKVHHLRDRRTKWGCPFLSSSFKLVKITGQNRLFTLLIICTKQITTKLTSGK